MNPDTRRISHVLHTVRTIHPPPERYAAILALVLFGVPLVVVSVFAVLYLGVTVWAGFHGFTLPAAAVFRLFPKFDAMASLLFPAVFHGLLLYAIFMSLWMWVGSQKKRVFHASIHPVSLFITSWLRFWGLPCLLAYFLLMLGVHAQGASSSGDMAFTVSGLLPYSDGDDFLYDARLMELTGKWSYLGAQRPMAAGLRNFWLAIGGTFQNFQMLQTVFGAFALWIAARSVGQWRGTPAALALCALCGPLAFSCIASPGTEANGMSAALLTLPLFIAALRTGSSAIAACALAGTFLALMLRMGAFFVIPALFLWILLFFRKNRRASMTALALSLFFVLIIAGSNIFLTHKYGPQGMTAGGNFSYALCGMSVGGDWSTCDTNYKAELAAQPGMAAHHKFLYTQAYKNIHENPFVFLKSMAINGAVFLRYIWGHTTGNIVEELLPLVFLFPLLALFCHGYVWYLHTQKEHGEFSLYLTILCGLFFSALFLMRSAGFRAIASTYPLLWLMLSVGFSAPAAYIGARSSACKYSALPSALGLGFIFLASVSGPLVAKTNMPYYGAQYRQHLFEENEIVGDSGLLGGLTVVADDAVLPNDIPALREAVFLRKITDNYWGYGGDLAAALQQKLHPPYTLYAGIIQYHNGALRPSNNVYIAEGGKPLPPGKVRYFLATESFHQAPYAYYLRLLNEKPRSQPDGP